ncbi:hypothetical protein CSV72_13570 [Sporosarcina sp. P20a]|uniref:hypothetical protein n=1 Tax=Sporosarcina sp. P20a TaxID=2048256 RepID=UPI000C167397|nr:hypothetical protein [Sporosarcina sp. P20a]PIC85440.1 hypothetical protein CSV72_13570 [Sporosarcina sp. P20a]
MNGSAFSGTESTPKLYPGNVKVSVTDMDSLENAIVGGNLILTGTAGESLSFSNIQVGGNLDVSNLDGDLFNFEGVDVKGDTIL